MSFGRSGPKYRPKCRTCERSRRPNDLMCSRCWAYVPPDLQQEIYRAWTRGSIHQTDAYFAAVAKATAIVEAILHPEPKPEEGPE